MLRHLTQAGDTIVEVLIAIVIVSFVLVAAYTSVNRNTLANQDTQERSQALQLATTQLEFLHTIPLNGKSCYDATGTPASTAGDCMVNADGTKDTGHTQPEFTIAITNAGSNYKVQVSWTSLVIKSTPAQIVLYYQP